MVVKELNEYIINFVGLKLGVHNFEYLITSSFFESMQSEEEFNTDIKLKLQLEKQTNLLVLNFDFYGTLSTTCDRCADPLDISIKILKTLYFNISDSEKSSDDDDVIYISTSDFQIDISQHVYEIIMVSIPMKKVHLEDFEGNNYCNPETLKFYEESLPKSIDPRWEVLKKLKDKQ